MNVCEAIAKAKAYNKWRRGRGKKYQAPGFPFNPDEIGDAIDILVGVAMKVKSPRMYSVVSDVSSEVGKTLAYFEKYDCNWYASLKRRLKIMERSMKRIKTFIDEVHGDEDESTHEDSGRHREGESSDSEVNA